MLIKVTGRPAWPKGARRKFRATTEIVDIAELITKRRNAARVNDLPRLSKHLDGAKVWAKREDVNSGLAFGGNKTRKLEYIVPDAIAQGADVRLDSAGFDIGIRSSWEQAIKEVQDAGGKPYPIPAGASEHHLGGLGFANWAYEVERQEAEMGVFFDTIIVCTVTGSTHAGMIAGFAGQDRPRRVIGIDASASIEKTRAQVARIARHTAELIGLGRELRDDEIDVREGWAGDLYGIPAESTMAAIRLSTPTAACSARLHRVPARRRSSALRRRPAFASTLPHQVRERWIQGCAAAPGPVAACSDSSRSSFAS